jgi:holo-[acyl-carrier-protein] synthase
MYLASRWAFKEATVKATGNKELVFSQMYLHKNNEGRPGIVFLDQNKLIIEKLQIADMQVSISHENDYSVAFVIAIGL